MNTSLGAIAPRQSGSASRWALTGVILAVSMTTIDQTIVALSVPTIEQHLGVTHDAMQWVVNIYLLATAAFFLVGGRLADVFGYRRMVIIGIAGFGLTSLLCGCAPNGDFAAAWLIVARALQGVSGAIMFPAAIGIVVEAFPRETRGRSMATFFTITGAMTAVGPIAGGYLNEWTWRAIFWVNVPIAIVALILVPLTTRASTRRYEKIDWMGAAVIALGMIGVVFGLQQASSWGWTNPVVLVSLGLGAILIVTFVVLQSRSAIPLLRIDAFRDRGFLLSTLCTLFASAAFVSTFFFLSVYGQVSLAMSPMDTGLLFLKLFAGFVIGSRIGSSWFDRHGARLVIIGGGLVGAFGFAWLTHTLTNLNIDPVALFNAQTLPIVVAGLGFGLMLTPVSTDAVNRAVGARYSEVSAVTQTMKNFGAALGMAVFSTMVTSALTTSLTASFAKFGGTAHDAQSAINQLQGASSAHDGGPLAHLPQVIQEQVTHAVQNDYALAAQWAFGGMVVAMVIVAVLGVFYPKQRTSHNAEQANKLVSDTTGPALN